MSIYDNLTVEQFKTQFPRFSPQYLSEITYVEGTTYFKDDIVYYETNKLFYKVIVENTTTLPTVTTDWALYNTTVLNYTQDSDILNAYNEAKVNFNESLFPDESTALMVFLYLAAFYVTFDMETALGANDIGILSSKSVGSVSTSYTVPSWISNNPTFSIYAKNGYGMKYLSLIKPFLCGNIILLRGATTTS